MESKSFYSFLSSEKFSQCLIMTGVNKCKGYLNKLVIQPEDCYDIA